jgi:hypothetical protein
VQRAPIDRQIRWARLLALVFIVAGAVVIFVGWNGAARQPGVDQQFPYLISGGIAGLALVVLGLGVLLIAQIRSERQRLQRVVDIMEPAVRKLAGRVEAPAAKSAEPFLFQIRHVRMLGVVALLGGGVLIFLGWNGAARRPFVDEQFPYVISGGMGGLSLLVLGIGVLLIAQIRIERQKLMQVLEVMATAVSKSVGVADMGGAEPAAPSDILVVAGPSTFHRPECKLVQGKPGLDRLTLDVAQSTGLTPCRVCDPLGLRDVPLEVAAETLVPVGSPASEQPADAALTETLEPVGTATTDGDEPVGGEGGAGGGAEGSVGESDDAPGMVSDSEPTEVIELPPPDMPPPDGHSEDGRGESAT